LIVDAFASQERLLEFNLLLAGRDEGADISTLEMTAEQHRHQIQFD
jgi:hypothetical protein